MEPDDKKETWTKQKAVTIGEWKKGKLCIFRSSENVALTLCK